MSHKTKRKAKWKKQLKDKTTKPIVVAEPPMVLPVSTQTKILGKAASRCRRAWDTMSNLESEIRGYIEKDDKAYRAWYVQHFSEYDTKREDLIRQCRELGELIYSVEREADYSNIPLTEAYKRVTAPGYSFEGGISQQQGFFFGEDSDDGFQCDCESCRARRAGSKDGASAQQTTNAFAEDGKFGDIDPDAMFEAMAEEIFAESYGGDFRNSRQGRRAFEVFKKRLAKESGFASFKNQFDSRTSDSSSTLNSLASTAVSDNETSCAVIYRFLVKHLHPDVISEQSKTHQELWLMTQDAYRKRDLSELRKVRVLLAMLKGTALDGLSVAEVQAAGDVLQHKNNQRRKEIRKLKRGEIWGFASLPYEGLQERAKRENHKIRRELSQLQQDQRMLQEILEGHRLPRNPARARSRRSEPAGSWYQEEFEF